MLLKKVIESVENYFKVINKEFFGRNVKWSVLDRYNVEDNLNIVVEVVKNDSISKKKYVISEQSSNSYRLSTEKDFVQIILKEDIAKGIAIDSYGGQVPGTSLIMEESWMDHLNVIPAT